MMRGEFAVLIMPNELSLFTFPSGCPNCAWLKVLNASARNSRLIPSLMAVSLRRAASKLLSPGAAKNRRFALPICPRVSGEKRAVLK